MIEEITVRCRAYANFEKRRLFPGQERDNNHVTKPAMRTYAQKLRVSFHYC